VADPYLLNDGSTLKNKLGLRDPEALQVAETLHADRRATELRAHGLPDAQGFERVKAVHKHLFQDVYEWAGTPRIVNLQKDHTQFTAPQLIELEGRRIFADLESKNNLRGLPKNEFARELAEPFAQLNNLHPFREGNGRTQRLIWEHVARQAGHDLSFEGISQERMIVVSIAAHRGDLSAAARMFGELLDPQRAAALRKAVNFLDRHRSVDFDWTRRYVATMEPGRDYSGTFVGGGGTDFIMHNGKDILIGRMVDLPNSGTGLRAGTPVSFRGWEWSARLQHQLHGRNGPGLGR
jgi:cell filamentation protein